MFLSYFYTKINFWNLAVIHCCPIVAAGEATESKRNISEGLANNRLADNAPQAS